MQIFLQLFCVNGIFFVPLQPLMRRIVSIGLLLCLSLGIFAQTHTRVYTEQVRTLRVERAYLTLTDGAIDGSDEENVLHISFDEMSHDVHFYSFSVRHMTADWSRESDILSGEYLRGFTTQDITDYEHSINTSREYTHYRFDFPNPEMIILRSGNYLLSIYEDGDPDKRIAEVQCRIVEPMAKIDTKVHSHTDVEFNGRFQQVEIDVNTAALDLRDPNEIRVMVSQNNRTDNAVWMTRPTFIDRGYLRYQQQKDLIFEGGNEYHHFDAFSCFYAGTGIDRVFHELGDYQVLLFADELSKGTYIHSFDADGRYLVNAERTNDSDTEAEYMWVHWVLPVDMPWLDGAVYVGGDLFGNEMSMRNRMQYDAQAKCYWLTSLVKQGGYDYQYWFSGKGTQNKTTTQRVDGSYWQTENEYVVYVYWRPFGSRYDRLVGVQVIHSNS